MEDEDRVLEVHALMELTEANVSPVADTEAWETEVEFLQQDGVETPQPLQDAIDDVLEVVTILA
jgi:hypothetical protein